MDLITKIKNQLKALVSKQTFAQHKAGDMMISSPDEVLTIGSEVYAVDAEGNNVAIADGSYKLDSGEVIIVEGGKVKEMEAAEVEGNEGIEDEMPVEATLGEDMPKEEEPKEEMPEEMPKEEEPKEDKVKEEIEEMKKKIDELYSFMEEFKKTKKEMEQKEAEFSAIVPEPAEKSIENKQVELKSEKGVNLDLDSFRERIKKLVK